MIKYLLVIYRADFVFWYEYYTSDMKLRLFSKFCHTYLNAHGASLEKSDFVVCEHQRRRPACAVNSAQCYPPYMRGSRKFCQRGSNFDTFFNHVWTTVFNIYTKCPLNWTIANMKTHMQDTTECINSTVGIIY